MSEDTDRLREALTAALPFLEAAAEPDVIYGVPCGGDPRNFTPDPECSTEAERAAHAADCAAWERGEQTRIAPVHVPLDMERSLAGQLKGALSSQLRRDADGYVTGGHVTRSGYGLGTSVFVDEEAARALAMSAMMRPCSFL